MSRLGEGKARKKRKNWDWVRGKENKKEVWKKL